MQTLNSWIRNRCQADFFTCDKMARCRNSPKLPIPEESRGSHLPELGQFPTGMQMEHFTPCVLSCPPTDDPPRLLLLCLPDLFTRVKVSLQLSAGCGGATIFSPLSRTSLSFCCLFGQALLSSAVSTHASKQTQKEGKEENSFFKKEPQTSDSRAFKKVYYEYNRYVRCMMHFRNGISYWYL